MCWDDGGQRYGGKGKCWDVRKGVVVIVGNVLRGLPRERLEVMINICWDDDKRERM